jgi:putative intracellular protease/amidase
MGFIATPNLAALIESTKKAAEIDPKRFDAIIVAGGQGPMFSFEGAIGLQKKFVEFYEAGKVACALCHGVAILRSGAALATGKTVTGFESAIREHADP